MTSPSVPPAAPPQGRGTNWGKIVLFGCLGLVVLTIVIGAIGAVAYLVLRKERGGAAGGVETVLYQSSDHSFSGVRQQYFVDFSFRYPAHWEVIENETNDTPNFIKVENRNAENTTIENFAVGYIWGDLQAPGALEQLREQTMSQIAPGFPNFQRVGYGSTTFASKPAQEATFQGHAEVEHRDFEYYGRVLLVPATANRGAVIIALATDLAEGVEGPAQVGERGELATIFDSFQFGGAGGATTAGPPAPAPAAEPPEVHQGTLEPGDLVREDNTLYDSYSIGLEAGDSLSVTLESGAFDAYLTVRSPSGQVYNDDDSGGGRNARLSIVAAEAGTWTIIANAYRTGEQGVYTLTIDR